MITQAEKASLMIPVNLRIPPGHWRPIPSFDSGAARAALASKRAEWTTGDLRQVWADESHMRQSLRAASIRISNNNEPATVRRMKFLLRKVGINGPEIQEAVGVNLGDYLKLNPRLPLWAAVALVLEANGRFTSSP